jgi:ATP-dependent RNA/DNA helicase IGHMBP2
LQDSVASIFIKDYYKPLNTLVNNGVHFTFIDTAGSGFEEKHGPDGISLQNEGELHDA